METEAILDIFDDIGEYEDWDGTLKGTGPMKISSFLHDHPDVTDITVRICSNGGDVFEGIAVHNLLKNAKQKITVDITGIAASAASIIAMAGDKVVMHKMSQMMIHNCWTFAAGDSVKLRQIADQMDKIMESVKEGYLEKSTGKLSAEKLTELLDAESYLTAEQCLEYGLCDEVDGKPVLGEPEEKEPENPAAKIQPSFKADEKPVKWFF